jgi:hypothetical protein
VSRTVPLVTFVTRGRSIRTAFVEGGIVICGE